jgi:hypothetical protein
MILSEKKENFIIDCYLKDIPEVMKSVSLPETSEEKAELLRLAFENKISAQLYLQLKKCQDSGLSLSAEILAPLQDSYEKIRQKNIKRLQAGLPVLCEMKKRGIEVIILKGNAIAEELYFDIGYKPMNDIDILIKKDDIEKTLKVFADFSLLSAAPLEEDIQKQAKMSHHAPPFFDKGMDVFFGTHWDIAAPTRGLKTPVDQFWKDKVEFSLMGESFFRLNPLHFVFHLCVHLNAAKTGLREVGDIVKVLQKYKDQINAGDLISLTRQSNGSEEMVEAMALVFSLIPFKLAGELLSELKKDLSEKTLARIDKRVASRHKILHLRTNYISKIEKTFAFFSMSEAPLEKTFLLAKMWRLYLFVPVDVALKLNYEMEDASVFTKIISCIKAPAKISRVFIKDLGLFIFIFVTLRHQWVLLRSYFEFVAKKMQGRPVKNLDHFAKDMGLSLKEIKELQALD